MDPVTRDPKHVERLIAAALAYVKIAEEQAEYDGAREDKMRKAAYASKMGNLAAARDLRRQVRKSACRVFDYSEAHRLLVKAVQPFKE